VQKSANRLKRGWLVGYGRCDADLPSRRIGLGKGFRAQSAQCFLMHLDRALKHGRILASRTTRTVHEMVDLVYKSLEHGARLHGEAVQQGAKGGIGRATLRDRKIPHNLLTPAALHGGHPSLALDFGDGRKNAASISPAKRTLLLLKEANQASVLLKFVAQAMGY
jgi:hypothetical protein